MHRSALLELLKSGDTVFKYPLKVTFMPGEEEAVVSVPKRHFKRAVKRNLLKRRIREALRHNLHLLGGERYNMFFYYVGTDIESYDRIQESVCKIFSDMASRKADTAL